VKRLVCFTIGILLGVLAARSMLWAGQAPPAERFSFVQLCDPQLGMGGYDQDVIRFRQAVRLINALNVDFVVICGDLVNNFNDQSVADFLAIKSGLSMPCYLAAGNHDVGNTPSVSSLERYRAAIGEDYYHVEHNGYTFVIANTSLWKTDVPGESEAHDTWFRQTLDAASARSSPIVVVQHYPAYVTRPDEADGYYNLPRAKRSELLSLYETSGVVAVLAGHTHTTIFNDYKGVQLVNGETTSKNFDGRAFGFRLWRVDSPNSASHQFVPLAPDLDFNDDEIIDAADVAIMLNHWKQDYALCDVAPPPYGDGIVDVEDLVLLAEHLFEDYRMAAYWKLDETAGSLARDSGMSGADGTIHGDPIWRPEGGQVGGAIELDGRDDYIITPFVLDPGKITFSAFAWVKGGAPGQVVISQRGTPGGANWLCAGSSDGSLMSELKGTGRWDHPWLVSESIITDGNWHRIGLVWDGSERILYVDDIEVAKDTQAGLASWQEGVHLGAGKALEAGSFWSGLIDDVRIYNQAVIP
jgi:predicted phosphodiesterase